MRRRFCHSDGPRRAADGDSDVANETWLPRSWPAADNKAIAQKVGIKEQTVRNQLTSLFRRLGVSSRLDLAVTLAARVVERQV